MNAIENFTAAAMAYAGLWASWRTWRWALRPEVQPEPESAAIPWSEVAAPNVFGPRQPRRRPRARARPPRQTRLTALIARCEWALVKAEARMQNAWRNQEHLGPRRKRELKSRWLVLRARVERLHDLRWTIS
jgi:hypothetical protein